MIAQVIVDVVHTNVDRPFSYLIPEGMEVEQGSRVSVPLGKRRVDGFVVSLLEEDRAAHRRAAAKTAAHSGGAGRLSRPAAPASDAGPSAGGGKSLPPVRNSAADVARRHAHRAHSAKEGALRRALPRRGRGEGGGRAAAGAQAGHGAAAFEGRPASRGRPAGPAGVQSPGRAESAGGAGTGDADREGGLPGPGYGAGAGPHGGPALDRRPAGGAGQHDPLAGKGTGRVPAPWRDRQRQDRGLPGHGAADTGNRQGRDYSGARDRFDPPDGALVPQPLRRKHRRASQPPDRRPTI